jgi:hypothetical protein
MMHPKLKTLLAVVLALCVVTTPVAALPGGDTTSIPEPSISESVVDGVPQPTFIVEYDQSDADSLQTWADDDTNRRLLSLDNSSGQAVVAAPSWQTTGVSLFDALTSGLSVFAYADRAMQNPLAARSYVESVRPNWVLSRTTPVERLSNATDVEPPSLGFTESVLNPDAEYDTSGIAYSSDASASTMREARDVLGVDNVTANADGQVVAVVDTGVCTANGRLFQDRLLNASKNMRTNETVAQNGTDVVCGSNHHGSWVASSIAANATNDTHDGIAPNASVLAIKALADDGSGSMADIAEGIRYAADEGADVISLSLGSQYYADTLADAVRYARSEGAVVVVAAGNSAQRRPVGVASPADVEGAIAVAATTAQPAGNASAAYFSQRSGQTAADGSLEGTDEVDIAAPGMQTTALIATESGRLDELTLSGTSMATPMVSGIVLLEQAANPSASANGTEARLEASARRMPNAAVAEVGAGLAAADRLIDGTNPTDSQSDAMDSPAEGRQQTYEVLAASSGGFLARVTRELGA